MHKLRYPIIDSRPRITIYVSSMADRFRAPTAAGHRNTARVYPYISPSLNAIRAFISDQNASKQRLQRFFSIVAGSICFAGIGTLIIWQISLALIGYPHFRLESLTVSNFSISNDVLYSGAWDAQFIVKNPNSKVTVYSDRIEVAVLHNFCTLSKTTVPGFVQGPKNKTAIKARVPYTEVFVDDFDKHGNTPIPKTDGVIKFYVWLTVRVQNSAWGARRKRLRVFLP